VIVPSKIEPSPPSGKPQKRPTIKDDKAQLAAHVAAMRALFHRPKLSTDTVKFLIRQRLSKSRQKSIKRALAETGCGHARFDETDAMGFWHRLEIQDPNDETYRCLASLLPGNRFAGRDIALDLPTDGHDIAATLIRELTCTASQRWRGNHETGECKGTFYGAERKALPTARITTRNWRVYLAKSGEPVVHFEAMYSGAYFCKGRDLLTASDLIGLDLADWLLLDFRFSRISEKKLDNAIVREARNIVWDSDARPRPTVAAVKEQLRSEIFSALKDPILPGESLADLVVQNCLDAHPLLRGAAVHAPFFDLSAALRDFSGNSDARAANIGWGDAKFPFFPFKDTGIEAILRTKLQAQVRIRGQLSLIEPCDGGHALTGAGQSLSASASHNGDLVLTGAQPAGRRDSGGGAPALRDFSGRLTYARAKGCPFDIFSLTLKTIDSLTAPPRHEHAQVTGPWAGIRSVHMPMNRSLRQSQRVTHERAYDRHIQSCHATGGS
jgi:hypothetical protein